MPIGRKQSVTHEDFVEVFDDIERVVSRVQYERAKQAAARTLTREFARKRVAFGWSGGKDSIALAAVCEAAGFTQCVFGMTSGLEYPAWLEWVTDNMPDELTVLRNAWDINWLAKNPQMLFPVNARIAAKWFKGIQHWAQETYFTQQRLDVLLLGRRRSDGNFCGSGKLPMYAARGVVRCSPIADWSHELVLASLKYDWLDLGKTLPPFYRWPRGFRCGTHAWPARQWTQSTQHGWQEIWQIDASIVRLAASRGIHGAAHFIATQG